MFSLNFFLSSQNLRLPQISQNGRLLLHLFSNQIFSEGFPALFGDVQMYRNKLITFSNALRGSSNACNPL